MSDLKVDKWKQQGHLYLWRYLENDKNYPGWNMTVDEKFKQSFADLVKRMIFSDWNSKKLIFISEPSKELLSKPNNRSVFAR